MNTYCLITVRDDKLAGIQPIRGSKLEDVINFTFGVLSERTKSDAAMFAALGVEWVLESGLRDLADIDVPAGPEIGRWRLVGDQSDPDLKWCSSAAG